MGGKWLSDCPEQPGWMLEFLHVRSWSLLESKLERNSKWEQQKERACRQWAASVSRFPISPPVTSARVQPPRSPSPTFSVSQSAGSGGHDVIVQSNFLWANQGTLLSPERESLLGWFKPGQRDRLAETQWWERQRERKHEINNQPERDKRWAKSNISGTGVQITIKITCIQTFTVNFG